MFWFVDWAPSLRRVCHHWPKRTNSLSILGSLLSWSHGLMQPLGIWWMYTWCIRGNAALKPVLRIWIFFIFFFSYLHLEIPDINYSTYYKKRKQAGRLIEGQASQVASSAVTSSFWSRMTKTQEPFEIISGWTRCQVHTHTPTAIAIIVRLQVTILLHSEETKSLLISLNEFVYFLCIENNIKYLCHLSSSPNPFCLPENSQANFKLTYILYFLAVLFFVLFCFGN